MTYLSVYEWVKPFAGNINEEYYCLHTATENGENSGLYTPDLAFMSEFLSVCFWYVNYSVFIVLFFPWCLVSHVFCLSAVFCLSYPSVLTIVPFSIRPLDVPFSPLKNRVLSAIQPLDVRVVQSIEIVAVTARAGVTAAEANVLVPATCRRDAQRNQIIGSRHNYCEWK